MDDRGRLPRSEGEMMDGPLAFAIMDRKCTGLLALLPVGFGAWLG